MTEAPISNTPTSSFYVNADRFLIGRGGVSPVFPFIAITSPQTINGKLYNPGVWMNAAYIGSATIDFAQITDTLYSSNWNGAFPGTGWRIMKDGNAWFNSLNARGNITANSLDVNTANIVSTLNLQGNAVTLASENYGSNYSLAQAAIYVPPEAAGQKIIISAWCGTTETTNPVYGTFTLTYSGPGGSGTIAAVPCGSQVRNYYISGEQDIYEYGSASANIIGAYTAWWTGTYYFYANWAFGTGSSYPGYIPETRIVLTLGKR
jgi:hypothetical protein